MVGLFNLREYFSAGLNSLFDDRYERIAWIPILATFIVILGLGGKHLGNPSPTTPVTVSGILGFAGTQAGLMIAWAGYAADYATYLQSHGTSYVLFSADASIASSDTNMLSHRRNIFLYAYAGLALPTVSLCIRIYSSKRH